MSRVATEIKNGQGGTGLVNSLEGLLCLSCNNHSTLVVVPCDSGDRLFSHGTGEATSDCFLKLLRW